MREYVTTDHTDHFRSHNETTFARDLEELRELIVVRERVRSTEGAWSGDLEFLEELIQAKLLQLRDRVLQPQLL